jgi:hypothetical protein
MSRDSAADEPASARDQYRSARTHAPSLPQASVLKELRLLRFSLLMESIDHAASRKTGGDPLKSGSRHTAVSGRQFVAGSIKL